jgi:hypothetical protein
VWRNIFSAFAVRVLAWIKVIPKGFDLGDVGVLGEEDVDVVESGGDGVGTTWGKGGVAVLSCGEDGRPGHVVRDKVLDEADTADPVSELEDWLECLLIDLVKVDEALLKSDLAGDVVMEGIGVPDVFVDWGDGKPGILVSLRTTIRVRCKRFRANLVET